MEEALEKNNPDGVKLEIPVSFRIKFILKMPTFPSNNRLEQQLLECKQELMILSEHSERLQSELDKALSDNQVLKDDNHQYELQIKDFEGELFETVQKLEDKNNELRKTLDRKDYEVFLSIH
jgi:hypothetical protein